MEHNCLDCGKTLKTNTSRRCRSCSQKGKKISEEMKEKLRQANLGKKQSPETREKRRQAMLGKNTSPVSEETREKLRKSHLGKKHTEEQKIKIKNSNTGKKRNEESRKRIGEAKKGKLCTFWKGGVSGKNKLARASYLYKDWRETVFSRDNWTCQKTDIRGGELEAHHICNFSDNIELRFDPSNGITLSEESHKEFHKIYGKHNNTREQLEEFLATT